MAYTETQILAIGGSLWEKNGTRRVYLNNLAALHAAATGSTLSKSKRFQLADEVRSVYLDCSDGEIAIVSRGDRWDDVIHDGIAALVAELPGAGAGA